MAAEEVGDLSDRLLDASLVVDVHHGDQKRIFA